MMRGVYRLFRFRSSPFGNWSFFVGSLQYSGICRFVNLLAASTGVWAEAKFLPTFWPSGSQHCLVLAYQS